MGMKGGSRWKHAGRAEKRKRQVVEGGARNSRWCLSSVAAVQSNVRLADRRRRKRKRSMHLVKVGIVGRSSSSSSSSTYRARVAGEGAPKQLAMGYQEAPPFPSFSRSPFLLLLFLLVLQLSFANH